MLAVVVVGFVFGFIGSMPLAGPIAVMVFAAAIEGRPRAALFIGLGCALAEAGYATFAFWGFSTFLTDYPWIEPVSQALAAVILVALGIAFMLRKHKEEVVEVDDSKKAGSFALGFSVTALNPTLIGTWAAATTILFSTGAVELEPAYSALFGVSAATGIAAWYWALVFLVRRFKHRFKQETLNLGIRVMGLFLLGIGAWFSWEFGSWVLA